MLGFFLLPLARNSGLLLEKKSTVGMSVIGNNGGCMHYLSTRQLPLFLLIYFIIYIYEKYCVNFRYIYVGFNSKVNSYLSSYTDFLSFFNELNVWALVFILPFLILFHFACFNSLPKESFGCIWMTNGKNNQVSSSLQFISSSMTLNK